MVEIVNAPPPEMCQMEVVRRPPNWGELDWTSKTLSIAEVLCVFKIRNGICIPSLAFVLSFPKLFLWLQNSFHLVMVSGHMWLWVVYLCVRNLLTQQWILFSVNLPTVSNCVVEWDCSKKRHFRQILFLVCWAVASFGSGTVPDFAIFKW